MESEIISYLAEDSSSRPPVLFVHGGFHAAWCWEEHFLPYFSNRGFDSHAVSLRGHGRSPGHENLDAWGIPEYCSDVRAACDRLAEPAILVGHSIGAVLVQQVVQSYRAAAMVLVAPTPLASMPLAKLRWAFQHPVATARMLASGDINHALPAFRRLFFAEGSSDEEVDRYMARMCRESNKVFRDIRGIRTLNPEGVHIPALVVAAEYDRVPPRIHRQLARAFGGELQSLPVAHDMMLGSRWQLAADRIIEWITSLDSVATA